MKILVVGDWHSNLHEEALFQAFKKLGHQVEAFSWHQYFQSSNWLSHIYRRTQYKYIIGPIINKLNRDLVEKVYQVKPEMVFIYRGTHILADTLNQLKKINTTLVGYNNDDPFSPHYAHWPWRHFIKSIPAYDLMLAYRKHNIQDFINAGAKRVELLRSWFVPEQNYPIELTQAEKEQYACDVVFIGHYEDDGRLRYLEEIVKQGFHLKLYGPGYDWNPVLKKSAILSKLTPVELVWKDDYNRALCGAKIALCFLSNLNRDTYTRRCFEIPATKTMMLSEYSGDLAGLFVEGEEVEFFNNEKDIIYKIHYFLKNESMRKQIAKSGYERVIKSGHDVISRTQQILEWVKEVRNEEITTLVG